MSTNDLHDGYYQDLVTRTLREVPPNSFMQIKQIAHALTEDMRERDSSFTLTDLSIGHPALLPPLELRQAEARWAMELAPPYGDFSGSLDLRTAGAKIFNSYFGLPATKDDIYVTAGAMAMNHMVWTHLGFHKMNGNHPRVLNFEPGYSEVFDQLEEIGFKLSDVVVPLSIQHYREDRLIEIARIAHGLKSEGRHPLVAHWSHLGNPIPFSFSLEEYKTLGDILNDSDVIGFEDCAYPMDLHRGDWKEGYSIPNIARHANEAILNVSLSKLLGLGNRRCAFSYVSPKLRERFTRERKALSWKDGVDEIRSRIRHTHTHAPLPIQLAVAEYLSQSNVGERIRTGIEPYPETCEQAYQDLQKAGYFLALTNPNGQLAKVFYLPMNADFETFLRARMLATPLQMFSSSKKTQIEGVRIAIPGIMPHYETGSRERYERFQERLQLLR